MTLRQLHKLGLIQPSRHVAYNDKHVFGYKILEMVPVSSDRLNHDGSRNAGKSYHSF